LRNTRPDFGETATMIDALVIILVIVLTIASIAGAIYYWRRETVRARDLAEDEFRDTVLKRLRKCGPSKLAFDRLVQESEVDRGVCAVFGGKYSATIVSRWSKTERSPNPSNNCFNHLKPHG